MSQRPWKRGIASVRSCGIVLLLVCAAFTASASAATVRGKLDRVDGNGRHYPAPYIAVTVNSQQRGRSAPAHTDASGMYYIYNIPRGHYTLEIWVDRDPRHPPTVYNISVNSEPYSDIAPIVVH